MFQLHLGMCNLDNSDCNTLGTIVSSLRSLKVLGLSENKLGSQGFANFKSALIQSEVEVIYLCDNSLDSTAGHVLNEILQNSWVKKLYVSNNLLGNNGVARIVEGAASNRTVNWLDMSWTRVDNKVLGSVTTALTRQTVCRRRKHGQSSNLTICLHGNSLSKAALYRSSTAFAHNTHGLY